MQKNATLPAKSETNFSLQNHLSGGWTTFGLLLVLTLNVAWIMNAANWTRGLHILQWVAFGGLLAGTGFAFSRWGSRFASVYLLIVGAGLALIFTATIVPGENGNLFDKIILVGEQSVTWTLGLLRGRPIANNLVFVLQVAFLCWAMAFYAAWAVLRYGYTWRVIVSIGLVVLLNAYYGPPNLGIYLLVFLVASLLLVIRTTLSRQEEFWQETGVAYANDIGFSFLRDGLIFTIIVVLLAWGTPTAASSGQLSPLLEPLQEPWEAVREEWGRVFSSLNYQSTSQTSGFGRSLTLSGPRTLGNRVVMDVKAPVGTYWRGVTFDTFDGHQWKNSDTETANLGAENDANVSIEKARRVITQTITTYMRGETVLFAAPQPIATGLTTRADVSVVSPPTSENEKRVVEISRLRSRQQLREGQSYAVASAVSTADVASLQKAGTAYPAHIRERYFALSPDFSPRIQQLAQQITASAQNPFDKATAIETFVRNTIKYNEKIDAPPANVDPLEYVLFESKEGYCDYYASIMATMARSVGIPARVVAGYAQGEYESTRGVFRVRESNAHSWVEVYFPGYGWIEFEPTAAQPAIARQTVTEKPANSTPEPLQTTEPSATSNPFDNENKFGEEDAVAGGTLPFEAAFSGLPPVLRIILPLFVVGIFIAAAFVLRNRQRQKRAGTAAVVNTPHRVYEQLQQWATRVGLGRRVSQTPFEHAAVLTGAIPESAAGIHHITNAYVHEQFSPVSISAGELEKLTVEWDSLQPILQQFKKTHMATLSLQERARVLLADAILRLRG